MKIQTVLIIVVLILTTACTVNKQLTTLVLEENESLVGGRINILYNGYNITSDATIFFNEISLGTFNYKPDSLGYIVTKLPIGDSSLRRIAYENFFYNFSSKQSELSFKNEKDQINYIGDLTVNWVGAESKISGMFGLVGAIIDELNNDGEIEVYAEDNEEQFMDYFRNKYNSELVCNNLVLNLAHPDSMSQHKLFSDPSINPKYLTFSLTKDRSCSGTLRMIKKQKIFVEQNRKLFIFKEKDLLSITDHEGNDVTEEVLKQIEFKKINFNKYETINM